MGYLHIWVNITKEGCCMQVKSSSSVFSYAWMFAMDFYLCPTLNRIVLTILVTWHIFFIYWLYFHQLVMSKSEITAKLFYRSDLRCVKNYNKFEDMVILARTKFKTMIQKQWLGNKIHSKVTTDLNITLKCLKSIITLI